MKFFIMIMSLCLANIALATNKPMVRVIVCKNMDSNSEGCNHILISRTYDGFSHISLSEYDINSKHTCSNITYLDDNEKPDLSQSPIYLSGKSSAGSRLFERAFYTIAQVEIDTATGEGLMKYKSGKSPEINFKRFDEARLSECSIQKIEGFYQSKGDL
ncbi:MAG TPA: hypothetical protein VIG33_12935 [Pseudobdellovibrionaceae bacterium]|jgi:hypothetical protein